MLQYAASDNMLVDYITKEHQGNFDLHIPEDQCAYLQFSDGREGFFETGDHAIRMDRCDSLFRRYETVNMYWFNLCDHIELHLADTVQVMERLLKTVAPDLKLYAPIDTCVYTDITVRIEDREKLLQMLFTRQAHDFKPVLDKQWLTRFLEKKLHYLLEETINHYKQEMETSIFNLYDLAESLEIAMINDICSLLESMSIEVVAAHVSKIVPTRSGMENYRKREDEALAWFNQVQMENFSKHSSRSRSSKKKEKLNEKQTASGSLYLTA